VSIHTIERLHARYLEQDGLSTDQQQALFLLAMSSASSLEALRRAGPTLRYGLLYARALALADLLEDLDDAGQDITIGIIQRCGAVIEVHDPEGGDRQTFEAHTLHEAVESARQHWSRGGIK